MVVKVNADGSYNISLSETQTKLLDQISNEVARPANEVLGNLLFGALAVAIVDMRADGVKQVYNPALRD